VTQVGSAREEALGKALDTLEPEDLERLAAAVPAMKRLSKALARTETAVQPQ
jgi:hypothetical protein